MYQPLRSVEAIWRRMRDVFADFLPRHTVDVYLVGKQNIARPAEIHHWNTKCLLVIYVLRRKKTEKCN